MKRAKCHICGNEAFLTYEHVPPRKAFNEKGVIVYSGDAVLNSITSGNLPWDFSKEKGHLNRRGMGFETLCENCNNKTGAWYGNAFIDFIKQGYDQIKNINPNSGSKIKIVFRGIYPLRILKQAISLFFSINNTNLSENHQLLRDFVLIKNNRTFDEYFKIYLYISKGETRRCMGFGAVIKNLGKPDAIIRGVSELTIPPFGFVLEKEPKDEDILFDITNFVRYNYEKKVDLELELPILEVNNVLFLDYRTKDEILAQIKKNEEFKSNVKGSS